MIMILLYYRRGTKCPFVKDKNVKEKRKNYILEKLLLDADEADEGLTSKRKWYGDNDVMPREV